MISSGDVVLADARAGFGKCNVLIVDTLSILGWGTTPIFGWAFFIGSTHFQNACRAALIARLLFYDQG